MISKKTIIAGAAIILIAGMANAMFSGSHNLSKYRNETAPQEFCKICHSASVANVSAGVHKSVNCICHGYNPNATAEYNVNMTHALSKEIYCTNCHSKYNETTGNIILASVNGVDVSGLNQSAHYIMNRSDQLFNNSRAFFDEKR
jgi:hypothetical protein